MIAARVVRGDIQNHLQVQLVRVFHQRAEVADRSVFRFDCAEVADGVGRADALAVINADWVRRHKIENVDAHLF